MGSLLSIPTTDADLLSSPDAYDSRSLRTSVAGYKQRQKFLMPWRPTTATECPSSARKEGVTNKGQGQRRRLLPYHPWLAVCRVGLPAYDSHLRTSKLGIDFVVIVHGETCSVSTIENDGNCPAVLQYRIGVVGGGGAQS